MDAAKQAISKLTSSHGHHTTEVHEHYNPAVTHERIDATREHKDTTVVDNEVHQDHHHTSILPVQDREVLPTQHEHNLAAAKHTEHHHGDHQGIRDRVAAEAAQFKSKTEHGSVEKTHTVAPTVAGEHHHHHVHETIQPIVQKQTIQPSVVHTTIPVHEVHHNEPKHYTASALPAVSIDEFKKQGGSLTGLADRVERFEGEPENIAHRSGQSGHHGSHTGSTTGTGLGSSTTGSGLDSSRHTGTTGTSGSGLTGSSGSGLTGSSGTGLTGSSGSSGVGERSRAQQAIDSRVDGPTSSSHHGTTGLGSGSTGSGLHNTTSSGSGTTGKPSLLDRMNPFKDADGDGKKGAFD